MKVRRAHTDSQGRRWRIGDEVKSGEHPDADECGYLFDDEPTPPREAKPKPKRKREDD